MSVFSATDTIDPPLIFVFITVLTIDLCVCSQFVSLRFLSI